MKVDVHSNIPGLLSHSWQSVLIFEYDGDVHLSCRRAFVIDQTCAAVCRDEMKRFFSN